MALLSASLFVLASLAAPTSASASHDPIGSGTTRLTLDQGFARLLADNDVKLLAQGGARREGRSYTLPVSGGLLDPVKGKAVVKAEGVLVFQRGKRRLPLRRIELRTKREPLIAKVGGGQLKLAAGKVRVKRAGFGSQISITALRITDKFATRLAKKLRLRRSFAVGQRLGTIRSAPEPTTVAILPQGRATIALDPAIVARLNGLFVSINPIFPAELAPGPSLSFEIIRDGALAPDAASGTLRSAGAIEFLQQKAGQVFINEFWFDLGTDTALAELQIEPTPTFKGKLGQLPALTLGAATTSSDPRARTIGLSAAPLSLSAATATAFNEGFAQGKPTFSPGEPFGTLSFTAQAQ